jgi:tetratricopeptide (TPR) repeat protein
LKIHELRNELRLGRDKQESFKSSEPNRILKLAQKYSDNHDYAQAERKLRALLAMTENQPDFKDVYAKAISLLNVLLDERVQRTTSNWLPSALRRADKLIADGKRDEAISLWKAIVELYADDLGAAEQVALARSKLDAALTTSAANPPKSAESSDTETDPTSKAEPQ